MRHLLAGLAKIRSGGFARVYIQKPERRLNRPMLARKFLKKQDRICVILGIRIAVQSFNPET